MNPRILNTLLLAAGLALVAPAQAAPAHNDETHAGHPTASLQLNAGKKWETDPVLRQSMAKIRGAVTASLQGIHQNRLSAAGYDGLARKVEGEVGNIVANCKLEPKADAQLHLVIADLLAGAEQMSGKAGTKRQDGAVKVIAALGNYATYFDDPRFKPIAP